MLIDEEVKKKKYSKIKETEKIAQSEVNRHRNHNLAMYVNEMRREISEALNDLSDVDLAKNRIIGAYLECYPNTKKELVSKLADQDIQRRQYLSKYYALLGDEGKARSKVGSFSKREKQRADNGPDSQFMNLGGLEDLFRKIDAVLLKKDLEQLVYLRKELIKGHGDILLLPFLVFFIDGLKSIDYELSELDKYRNVANMYHWQGAAEYWKIRRRRMAEYKKEVTKIVNGLEFVFEKIGISKDYWDVDSIEYRMARSNHIDEKTLADAKRYIPNSTLDLIKILPEPKRPPIPSVIKQAVWKRDGGRCVECGTRKNLQFDHIIPLALGGANTLENIQLLCKECNMGKGVAIQ